MVDTTETTKEWTVMFYFASDNALAPIVVSQLKAIKDAGFQEDTNVLAHFDPQEPGARTAILNVNRERRSLNPKRQTMIGDGPDPFVRNMTEDFIDPKTINASAGKASKAIKRTLANIKEVPAEQSLRDFIGFCRENHPARHYVLFLVGHGMIVGSDAFLPDDHPHSAITMDQLESILGDFAKQVTIDKGAFELLALNSCSMSAIEVAYQLKDTANYMMATEGISFVGSWPFRQLLKETFNTIDSAKKKKTASKAKVDVPALVNHLFDLSLFNSTDFMLAGYSADLSLCKLKAVEVTTLTTPIQRLVARLKDALREEGGRGKELILLAHWKAQSFWLENYTDLYDFCQCLAASCRAENDLQKSLKDACEEVMNTLDKVVLRSEHFGPTYQYAHGLSIYFPWSRPLEDAGSETANRPDTPDGVMERYAEYAFTKSLGDDSWFSFLESYFAETMRDSRDKEDGTVKTASDKKRVAGIFNRFASGFGSGSIAALASEGKKATPATGEVCSCPSIKNYPMGDVVSGKGKRIVRASPMSDGALRAMK